MYQCYSKVLMIGAGEITRQLKALTALGEDEDLVPSTHMETHNHL